MNLQLYNVDSANYLVDFHHKGTYRASTQPGAGKFDMALPGDPQLDKDRDGRDSRAEVRSLKEFTKEKEEDTVVSPFIFMDVACRLILELAGGPQE